MQKKALTTFYKSLTLIAISLSMLIFIASSFAAPLKTASARQQVPLVPEQPFVWFEHSSVMLYHRNGNTLQEIVLLPQTYFAKVTDEDDTFFSVTYYDLTGFVRKSEVTLVDFKPVTIFATSSLTVTAIGDVSSVNIRSRPGSNSGIISSVSVGSTLSFYGTLPDNSEHGATTTTNWFFVRFTLPNNQTAWGYIYAANTIATPIPNNIIEKVMIYIDSPPIFSPENISWPSHITIIFIIALSIPAVLVMLILFKKPKTAPNTKKTPRSF